MKLMKAGIHYNYEEIPTAGRVRIEANDAIAVAASTIFFASKSPSTRQDSLAEPQN